MEIVERPLGPAAFVYIRERLATGHSLAHALNESLKIELGRVFAFLPEELPEDKAYNFKVGGVLPTPPESSWRRFDGGVIIRTPDTSEWLVSHVLDSLSANPASFAIFEESLAKPTDPFWQRQPENLDAATFVGDEVYYVAQTPDRQAISIAVNWADTAWPGLLGAVTAGDVELRDDAEYWSSLAKATTELAVGAYDGESYLIWTRAQPVGGADRIEAN